MIKRNKIWIIITITAAVLHLLFFCFTPFADGFNDTLSAFFRMTLAGITGIFPFSVAEILIFLSVPIAVLIAFIAITKKKTLSDKLVFVIGCVLKILGTVYIIFVLTFAPGYGTATLDSKLQLNKENFTKEDLYETMLHVVNMTNEAAKDIEFVEEKSSMMPFAISELSNKLCDSYNKVYEKYDLGPTFNSTAKPLIISPVMTYTHIAGVYSFFTGEANINTNYPDFVTVYSASHELAHQRGIAREDEANFIAYLVCINNEDPYIRYSGYLNMFNYLADALYQADPELYSLAVSSLDKNVILELKAYSDFFDMYRDSKVSEISDAVNDTYLKSQGTSGTVSYSMVTELAVAYHKNEK